MKILFKPGVVALALLLVAGWAVAADKPAAKPAAKPKQGLADKAGPPNRPTPGLKEADPKKPTAEEPDKGGSVKALEITDIKVGDGPEVKSGDRVSIHYTGWLKSNGAKFDSSHDKGRPFDVQVGRGKVIKGMDEGLKGMKVGGKRKIVVPAALGYGKGGMDNGRVPPNADLVYEVEVLAIKP